MKRITLNALFILLCLAVLAQTVEAGEMFDAVVSGDAEKVGQLMDLGVPANARYENQNTALHWAAAAGKPEVVKLLIKRGAEVNARNVNGWSPLMMATTGGYYLYYQEPLWEKESERDMLNTEIMSRRWELSFRADRAGRAGEKALLENVMETDGVYLATIELLIGKGANVNATDSSGHTPLELALLYSNENVVNLLVDNGADVKINGEENLYLAAHIGRIKVVSEMLRKGVAFDPLRLEIALPSAAGWGWVDMAGLLIDNGVNVNCGEGTYGTPLHFAASNGRKEMALFLIEKGAEVNAHDESRQTPLHKTVASGHAAMGLLLIGSGADVNARDQDQKTPLHLAACQESTEMARLLIENGADINALDQEKWTPLHWAAASGRTDMAELLIQKGAEVNIRNGLQWTAAETAEQSGFPELASLLRNRGGDTGK